MKVNMYVKRISFCQENLSKDTICFEDEKGGKYYANEDIVASEIKSTSDGTWIKITAEISDSNLDNKGELRNVELRKLNKS